MGIVYLIRNSVNGKVYIGKTIHSFQIRYPGGKWWEHTHNIHLKRAAEKYGEDQFTVEFLHESDSESELLKLELESIEKFNSLNKSYGYNMVLENPGSVLPSDEALQLSRENRSSIIKERYLDPEYKERWRQSIVDAYSNNPDLIAIKRRHSLDLHKNPEHREKMVRLLAVNRSSSELKEQVRAGIQKYHSENKEEFAKKNSAAWTEDRRRKQSERSKKMTESEESRAELSRRRMSYLSDPVRKAAAVENMKKGMYLQKQKTKAVLAARNSDPSFQKRALAVRMENRRRTALGMAKLTKDEKILFLNSIEGV